VNTVVIILNSVFVPKQLITGAHGAVQDPAVAVARGGENIVSPKQVKRHDWILWICENMSMIESFYTIGILQDLIDDDFFWRDET
jgi:hypothetical protein